MTKGERILLGEGTDHYNPMRLLNEDERLLAERIDAALVEERERLLTQIEAYGATGRMIAANMRLQAKEG